MSTCTCTAWRHEHGLGPDTDAERVAGLVAAGMGQWAASRIVWPEAEAGVVCRG